MKHPKEAASLLRPRWNAAEVTLDPPCAGPCATSIREAEAMATGGIGRLLITSELVGADKIARLVPVVATHTPSAPAGDGVKPFDVRRRSSRPPPTAWISDRP